MKKLPLYDLGASGYHTGGVTQFLTFPTLFFPLILRVTRGGSNSLSLHSRILPVGKPDTTLYHRQHLKNLDYVIFVRTSYAMKICFQGWPS